MARLKDLIAKYGGVALGTWLALFALTWLGFTLAIAAGVGVEGAGAGAGTVAAAYVATQATKPLRIAATLALTPMVAAALRRAPAADPAPGGPDAEHDPAAVAEPAPSEG